MMDAFVKRVIEELNEEAYEAYVSYISALLDFHTVDRKQIERTNIYKKMDELCQLTKWSALTKAPKSYTEQLIHYYEVYALCDNNYSSFGITPAYVFWKRGIESLKKFMDSDQSFKNIEYMEDSIKIFLCIMRERLKNTGMKKYSCKTIQFLINEQDIETINFLHQMKTEGIYEGIRLKITKVFGKTIIIPGYEENIVTKQKQPEKDYIYMVTTALYFRLMESEGFC